ncbi:peptidyl-prolyl cis-trans isomerase [Oceanomicrobium pacificus]|uniref:PpiC domain-containing protein n=1 Tax=Oceanomicrobium pacificus TaxID=2692916 RepID=A0A6B0TZ60_9RHOB|nr:peptidylprolyl isomerase [Oceanomicrobium pacificus]MXU64191.1 hypothetical protein [Oceanomicrobium pacificus]
MSVLKSPFLHFLLIGAGLFLLFDIVGGDEGPDPDRIEITDAQFQRLQQQFEASWNRPPTEAEATGILADHLREELLYREALKLGLDQNDAIIRQRLRQKMDFFTEAGVQATDPGDEELRAYLAANEERYIRPPRFALAQVFLGTDPEPDAVAEVLAALEGGAEPGTVGEPTLLPPSLSPADVGLIANRFGRDFATALPGLPLEEWAGPVPSSYGQHLVRIAAAEPAGTPDFEALRGRLLRDWRYEAAQTARQDAALRLAENYRIDLPGGQAAADLLRPGAQE